MKNDKKDSIDYLKNTNKVIEVLDKLSVSAQSNMLTIILLLTNIFNFDKEIYKIYQEKKKNINVAYFEKQSEQAKNEKESENWVDFKTLKKYPAYWKKQYMANKNEQNAFNWFVSSLYIGFNYLPPRRNIYNTMKYYVKAPINEKNNYFLDSPTLKQFVINDYKTSWKYGQQILKIPKNSQLLKALTAYRLYNKSSDLLLSPKSKKFLTSQLMTGALNRIFAKTGKKIGSSMLRKIFISHIYRNDKGKKYRGELARKMGHSSYISQLCYEKK